VPASGQEFGGVIDLSLRDLRTACFITGRPQGWPSLLETVPMIVCSTKTHWQPLFLNLLPRIERYARITFRQLPPDAREEAIQETIANCLVAFVKLWEQGRVDQAHPSVLARFSAAQVRDGRSIAHRINSGDVLSLRAYRRHGVQVARLDDEWQELVVEDKRAKPADVAAMRIDFAEWLRTLSARVAAIAKTLATGETTTAAARLFGLTCGRISQLRRELWASWHAFQGEPVVAAA
jgi:hypothetical protein